MDIKQSNLALELTNIQELLNCAIEYDSEEQKEQRMRHLLMATSRIGTLYQLLKEGE